jgi:quinone-modifying oxidoreductase subunit QmoA
MKAHTLVVGGGISGLTSAIELAELGREVLLIERNPYLGGKVAQMNLYFPKLCPPTCGLEINFRRIKQNPHIKCFTLATVKSLSGNPGAYKAEIALAPRYVNEKCTACRDCEKVCEIETDDEFNYGLGKRKAIYLPFNMAFPHMYVLDSKFVKDDRVKKCVEACKYDAIDLNMSEKILEVEVEAVVWATGWEPYDAKKIDNLGFGVVPNVITNVMLERLASVEGPTKGEIVRPSDGKAIESIAFAQCAGSRDRNHLNYCSGVCCLASIKQATYIREKYPEAEIYILYIDIRTPGRFEDFYVKVGEDKKIHFYRGKVAKVARNNGQVIVSAENTLTGNIQDYEVDLLVLATGMVPNTSGLPIKADTDEFGFLSPDSAVISAGAINRPLDVASCVQDATGAALKALQMGERR